MMKKILLLPVFALALLASAFSQSSVSGKILGPGDVPIQGLTVSAGDPAARTITDAMGQFVLPKSDDSGRILLHLPERKPVPVVLTTSEAVLIRVAADGSVTISKS